jgi:hypothetical protein
MAQNQRLIGRLRPEADGRKSTLTLRFFRWSLLKALFMERSEAGYTSSA